MNRIQDEAETRTKQRPTRALSGGTGRFLLDFDHGVKMTVSHRVNAFMTGVMPALIAVIAMLGGGIVRAAEAGITLSPNALEEIAQIEAEIDRIEAQAIERLAAPPANQVQQIELLGKLLLYDKQLSVNRNEACAFCHMPETGFSGPVSELNRTTGSYPGSVRTRFSERKPQSHAYAPLAPVLHYNPGQGDLVGGNFWDMRATGRRLGNPSAEQAQGPPTNPVEMGLPDIACAVYRASQRPYRALFERVWGQQAFAIVWPSNVAQVCDRPGPPPASDPTPVHLGELDRGRAAATFDQMAQSIANFEASAEVTSFTSFFLPREPPLVSRSFAKRVFRARKKPTCFCEAKNDAPAFGFAALAAAGDNGICADADDGECRLGFPYVLHGLCEHAELPLLRRAGGKL